MPSHREALASMLIMEESTDRFLTLDQIIPDGPRLGEQVKLSTTDVTHSYRTSVADLSSLMEERDDDNFKFVALASKIGNKLALGHGRRAVSSIAVRIAPRSDRFATLLPMQRNPRGHLADKKKEIKALNVGSRLRETDRAGAPTQARTS
ncbi:hypothetical protein EVAR_4136_1 [Eumeta japonica]|uniref:Uncharacterized protein n=1 Tax=Eumeta variegata TaxID=151549 RepID=A0A4C1TFT1_EUMVA|nr:hypothetical protein EVAR_4136_1 [Eumeta japonica]